ncbi:hypothetical protein A3E45_01925 [Candidatus Daviesbacteria bacterium RIFCSPHIGHO2_12_FULL_43_11]|uniref:Uncharacterized protein n=1 Tax=Candidatus Daviesbacteria bacterium RIFCSPHIGHO2_12_FULL_43_11 TaxID=1797780 RepID=A0A1F5K7R5_9BACT|nr:MAG: hypothetical protein A3E45_01925 [Candidatus Daviesbacteria bacterium RIFCSPHIGHO2_12_FULL_43_11]
MTEPRSWFQKAFIEIYGAFGLPGLFPFIGGLVLLVFLPFQSNVESQKVYGILGLILMSISVLIYKIRSDRVTKIELGLINMTTETNKRLAEQTAKTMSIKERQDLLQKIRQINNDTARNISTNKIEK